MTSDVAVSGSARRQQLLDSAYRYVLEYGAFDLSLRPLAASTGTSPRVLLYLFGSKDGLVREILGRARAEQRDLLAAAVARSGVTSFGDVLDVLWDWLRTPAQRATIRLFFEAYARSLHPDPGPWERFGRDSVEEWLDLLASVVPVRAADRSLILAVLRGLLLDLLATGELDRVDAAFRDFQRSLDR